MMVKTLVVGVFKTNCYIFGNENTKKAILIDPGNDMDYILDEIKKDGWNIEAILLTHGHFDHIGAVEKIRNILNVSVYANKKEQIVLEDCKGNLSEEFSHKRLKMSANKLFEDGDIFTFADNIVLKVISTPGHSPGSTCYYCEQEGVLFSGDTLFESSIGRTDLLFGNREILINSIKGKLFLLPDETKVFTGHGGATTIGTEKRENPHLADDLWED